MSLTQFYLHQTKMYRHFQLQIGTSIRYKNLLPNCCLMQQIQSCNFITSLRRVKSYRGINLLLTCSNKCTWVKHQIINCVAKLNSVSNQISSSHTAFTPAPYMGCATDLFVVVSIAMFNKNGQRVLYLGIGVGIRFKPILRFGFIGVQNFQLLRNQNQSVEEKKRNRQLRCRCVMCSVQYSVFYRRSPNSQAGHPTDQA